MNKKIKILSIASCKNQLNDSQNTEVINEYVYNRHQSIIKSQLFDLEIIDTSKLFEKKLEKKILKSIKKIDLIHIEINKPLKKETYNNNLGINFLRFIKKKYKIKLIFVWGDSAIPLFKKNIELTSDFAALNIITASFYIKKYFADVKNMIYIWDPIDNSFHYRNEKKDIDLLYIGQFKKNRIKFINYIKNNFDLKKYNIQLINKDDCYTSYKKYFYLFKKSKIILSFAETFGRISVTNARAFQATLSNCLLLEQSGTMTSRFFIPYKDYVPYSGKKDLKEKIDFFLKNEDCREKISSSGFHKSKAIYNSDNYWLQILNKIKIRNDRKNLHITRITENLVKKNNYNEFSFNDKIYLLKEKFFVFILNLYYFYLNIK